MMYTLTGIPRIRPDPMASKKGPLTPSAFASVSLKAIPRYTIIVARVAMIGLIRRKATETPLMTPQTSATPIAIGIAAPAGMPRRIRMTITAVDSARMAYWDTSISPITIAMNNPAAMIPRIEVFIVKFRMFLTARKYGEAIEKNVPRMRNAMRMLMISLEESSRRRMPARVAFLAIARSAWRGSSILSFPHSNDFRRGGAPASPYFFG